MKVKTIIYTRVSTDEQKEHGFSLREQENRLREYCKRNNLEIVAHYQDDHSAKNFNRPEFTRLLDDLKTKKIKAEMLLCVRWDRFSRNDEESLRMIGHLKKLGIEARTLENYYDLTVPENLLPFFINLVLPQVDNERRSLNTKRGMRQAMKEGRWTGKCPLGYHWDRRDNRPLIVPDQKTAPLVREIFEKFSTGAYTASEMQRLLVKSGLKYGKSYIFKMLRNPVYIGKVRIKAWKDEPGKVVIGLHAALIPEETFNKVQQIFERRKPKNTRQSKANENLPLRGHLVCRICGGNLTGSASRGKSGKRFFYYHCQSKCKERFRADKANILFVSYLKSFQIREDVLKLYYRILEDVFRENEVSRESNKNKIESEIEEFKLKKQKAQDKLLEDKIDQQTFDEINQRCNEKIKLLEFQLSELNVNNSEFMIQLKYSFSLLGNLWYYFEKASLEIKSKLVCSIFPDKIIIDGEIYRTPKVNEVLRFLTNNINELGEIQTKKAAKTDSLYFKASPRGLEPLLRNRKSRVLGH